MHDLVIRNFARFDAQRFTMFDDHRFDLSIWDRITFARQIVVPAFAHLLSVATHLAEQIGGLAVTEIWLFDIATLANRPADVVTGKVAHAERPHREPEFLDGFVDLLRRAALFQQKAALTTVLLDHAVADEAVAHAGHDRRFLDLFRDRHDSG